jgi:hypothetical protein
MAAPQSQRRGCVGTGDSPVPGKRTSAVSESDMIGQKDPVLVGSAAKPPKSMPMWDSRPRLSGGRSPVVFTRVEK